MTAKRKPALVDGLIPFAVAAAVLGVGWQLLSWAVHSPALPPPLPAVWSFFTAFRHGMATHLAVSTMRVLLSIGWAFVLGVPLGLWLGRQPALDRLLAPLLYILYPLPKVAFLPVVIIILGVGDLSKVFLIGIIVFFQILVSARDAARAVPSQLVDSVRSLGASEWDIYRHVIIPGSLPDIFTALRISVGTAVSVLFLTETFVTERGIGYYLIDAWSRLAYKDLFGGIIGMGLLGLVLYVILDFVETSACPWRHL